MKIHYIIAVKPVVMVFQMGGPSPPPPSPLSHFVRLLFHIAFSQPLLLSCVSVPYFMILYHIEMHDAKIFPPLICYVNHTQYLDLL